MMVSGASHDDGDDDEFDHDDPNTSKGHTNGQKERIFSSTLIHSFVEDEQLSVGKCAQSEQSSFYEIEQAAEKSENDIRRPVVVTEASTRTNKRARALDYRLTACLTQLLTT